MSKRICAVLLSLMFISFCFTAYAVENNGEINGCVWNFSKGVLTFEGSGVVPVQVHPYDSETVQKKFDKSVKQIVIGSDITGLERWDALYNYPSVTKVVINSRYFEGEFSPEQKIKDVIYTNDDPFLLAMNFCFCRLDKITFESQNADYVREGNFLFNRDKTELFYYFGSKSEKVVIPEGVRIIRTGAFAQSKIASVEFPSTLEKIERCAFIRCSGLKSITIPASCKSIGASAFAECRKLQDIKFLGDEISLISTYGKDEFEVVDDAGAVFVQCDSLKEITLPACEIIPKNCLGWNKNLKKVFFSEGTLKLGEKVFWSSEKLETVVLPDNIEFDYDNFKDLKKATIHCHAGSRAEEEAKEYKLKYKVIK